MTAPSTFRATFASARAANVAQRSGFEGASPFRDTFAPAASANVAHEGVGL